MNWWSWILQRLGIDVEIDPRIERSFERAVLIYGIEEQLIAAGVPGSEAGRRAVLIFDRANSRVEATGRRIEDVIDEEAFAHRRLGI